MKNHLICIISYNNLEFLKKAILEIQNVDDADLLIIDDGSDYNIIDEISDYKFIKCIMHETTLGYGTCIDAAFSYSKDMDYKYLITLDTATSGMVKDIPLIMENLKYGYEIVTCSRILENFDHDKIDGAMLDIYEAIAEEVNAVTDLNLTDPLSPNKGYSVKALQDLELTESGYGVLMQIFIQGVYLGSSLIEIPSEAGMVPGEELTDFDNPIEELHSVIETEKYLYNKGTIN